ncbi:hypothetical protein MCOR25_001186 [Pyricularia grisea]|nr:hypothetical protein MCOR25_001186 [Pyricularia grisea]
MSKLGLPGLFRPASSLLRNGCNTTPFRNLSRHTTRITSSSLSPSPTFATVRMSSSTQPTDRRPLVICGPSGVGKGTLIQMLFQRHPDTFTLSVSHTTRAPRPGEQDGVHYHYVTKEQFQALIAEDKFVEHAQFGSNNYGTSKATIEEQTAKGKVVVLDIEMEGVKQVKKSSISARYVFISPPSEEELEKRLRGRGTENEDSVNQRLSRAKEELAWSKTEKFDKVLVNDDLEKTFKELDEFVYQTPSQ